ncbi:MAG TPA: hypothetical protein VK721_14155 [Solirubrobacteraceae bacterium]|jgi:hypothetical protein|nr:hypothetical protein [Solirubrobacteraceae bacterium]
MCLLSFLAASSPFKAVRATLEGHRLKTVRKGGYVLATVNLEGLLSGGFTLGIRATTLLGLHLAGSRRYHTCAETPKQHKPGRLKVSGRVKS